ncbi:MAG: carboxypeptidase regulatory-like domain-containing protein [Acidobacteriaceae bacterium]|nr:carboxypeptidase regulatory-like domain-containing protein [Acidobacteriaceae bacterium]
MLTVLDGNTIPNLAIENWTLTLTPSTLRTPRALLSLACLLLASATAFASPLSGVVTDRTTGKPSAGDTIEVINMAQGMDPVAKTTSDSAGRFHVNAPDGGKTLLRVTHRGSDYYKSVDPASNSVAIDIYDSAAKIDGITSIALVLRAETDNTGKTINVAETIGIQNSSAPARTEFGGNTFDFYLPKGAEIQQTLASSPGGLPTNSDVKTLDAASGHYAFTFPIRPGETRFQVAYTLPYNGKQDFALRLSVPTGDVAVMLPKSMHFQGSAQFQPLNVDPNAQSFAAHEPVLTQPVAFSVSGTGQLPDESQSSTQGGAQAMGSDGGAQVSTSGMRPGGGLGAPGDPEGQNDPWARYKWWILSLLGVALIVGAWAMLKAGQTAPTPGEASLPAAASFATIPTPTAASAASPAASAASAPETLLQALRDELFALETDRLAGRLSESQYAEQKTAFDTVLRRAMARSESTPAASNEKIG